MKTTKVINQWIDLQKKYNINTKKIESFFETIPDTIYSDNQLNILLALILNGYIIVQSNGKFLCQEYIKSNFKFAFPNKNVVLFDENNNLLPLNCIKIENFIFIINNAKPINNSPQIFNAKNIKQIDCKLSENYDIVCSLSI